MPFSGYALTKTKLKPLPGQKQLVVICFFFLQKINVIQIPNERLNKQQVFLTVCEC